MLDAIIPSFTQSAAPSNIMFACRLRLGNVSFARSLLQTWPVVLESSVDLWLRSMTVGRLAAIQLLGCVLQSAQRVRRFP